MPTPQDPGFSTQSPPLPFATYKIVFRNPQWQDFSSAPLGVPTPQDPGAQPRRYPLPFAPSNLHVPGPAILAELLIRPAGSPRTAGSRGRPAAPAVLRPGAFALPGQKLRFPPIGYSPALPGVPAPPDPGIVERPFFTRGPLPFAPAAFAFNPTPNPVGPGPSLCAGFMTVTVTTRQPRVVVTSPNAQEYASVS